MRVNGKEYNNGTVTLQNKHGNFSGNADLCVIEILKGKVQCGWALLLPLPVENFARQNRMSNLHKLEILSFKTRKQ